MFPQDVQDVRYYLAQGMTADELRPIWRDRVVDEAVRQGPSTLPSYEIDLGGLEEDIASTMTGRF